METATLTSLILAIAAGHFECAPTWNAQHKPAVLLSVSTTDSVNTTDSVTWMVVENATCRNVSEQAKAKAQDKAQDFSPTRVSFDHMSADKRTFYWSDVAGGEYSLPRATVRHVFSSDGHNVSLDLN